MNPTEIGSGGNILVLAVKKNSQVVHRIEGGAADTIRSGGWTCFSVLASFSPTVWST